MHTNFRSLEPAVCWLLWLVTWLEIPNPLECELVLGGVALDLYRLKQESDVIAEVDLL